MNALIPSIDSPEVPLSGAPASHFRRNPALPKHRNPINPLSPSPRTGQQVFQRCVAKSKFLAVVPYNHLIGPSTVIKESSGKIQYLNMGKTRTKVLSAIAGMALILLVFYQNCGTSFSVQTFQLYKASEIPGPTPNPNPAPGPSSRPSPVAQFSFADEVKGPSPQLSIAVTHLNPTTGNVTINGAVSGAQGSFQFIWGDGSRTEGFFPQNHVYEDRTKNYTVEVRVRLMDGRLESKKAVVRFVAPQPLNFAIDPRLQVRIPSQNTALASRGVDNPPDNLTAFSDSDFGLIPRAIVEQVLTASAQIQYDLVNQDVLQINDSFQQLVLKALGIAGGFSVWFTNPVALAMGEQNNGIPWSSMVHEMGHNITLNFPAGFIYGGKIDGNANAIYSEGVAQIIQHSTLQILLSDPGQFGLQGDLLTEIELSARVSMALVRQSYEAYLAGGRPYSSWNNPATPGDETFGIFMTLAYKFFEHAEAKKEGYRVPTKRLFTLLSLFDAQMHVNYAQAAKSENASTFRSTLMIAAISFALERDLRGEFLDLNFPIDNSTFISLLQRASQKWAAL